MRVLLLGSGGREHALAWKLSQSPLLTKLYCAPGNPGIASLCACVAVNPEEPPSVVALCHELSIDLVVVGPEAPLVAGVADAVLASGITVFGPIAQAAAIEGSKALAKEIMHAANVPTARTWVFDDVAEAEAFAREQERLVVKADGLAAGKGVVVATKPGEAAQAVRALSDALGKAAQRLVLEELLEGEEVSLIALCDGERYALFPFAQDHKRVGDGDTGPNTGGMGVYAPATLLSDADREALGRQVIGPVLKVMAARGNPFRGALFAGLMLTSDGPKVLEYNCRFGDPETQVLMLQLDEDLLPLLDACARGKLEPRALRLKSGASVGVVLAAHGYPGKPRTGDPIAGLETVAAAPSVQVFHAGTRRLPDGTLVTSGGRVLSVCARGAGLEDAREKAYRALEALHVEGGHYRRDIGARGLDRAP